MHENILDRSMKRLYSWRRIGLPVGAALVLGLIPLSRGWADDDKDKDEGENDEKDRITVVETYDSGAKMSESEQKVLSDGTTVLDGKTTTWYENGQKASEQEFEDDVPDGKYREWYSNGNLKVEMTYEHGVVEGEVRTYHENGVIALEYVVGKEGVKDGEYTTFHENGEIETVGQFEEGAAVGEWASFSVDGESFVYEDLDAQ